MTRETRTARRVCGAVLSGLLVSVATAGAQRPGGGAGAPAGAVAGEGRASLTVEVTDREHVDGSAGVALWDAAEGFPEGVEHALQAVYVPVTGGGAGTTFDGLAPGRYAVTVFNDRNGNERFDKNWIGMPREPWGVSNDARPHLRAPRFDEAVFDLPAGATTITIELR